MSSNFCKTFPYIVSVFLCMSFYGVIYSQSQSSQSFNLQVAPNGRFLCISDSVPFFWLGDTGWLLFKKLNREEAVTYLEHHKRLGFNVIQVMVLHSNPMVNFYGDSAFRVRGKNIELITTVGDNPDSKPEYDYWDHCDFIIREAAKRGIFIALVPAWGSLVKEGVINSLNVKEYSSWLTHRMRHHQNILWLTGGDIKGDTHREIWEEMGSTIKAIDSVHLVTFHPFGRTQSSQWFHNSKWLDFNMFQSGHRRYDQIWQDDPSTWKGEDNWRYIEDDYRKIPAKPTIDGEPSYEGIPHGLHDTLQPLWNANDLRRYAYWSVFAGGFGFTYGNNSVMQFYRPGHDQAAYGAKKSWQVAMSDSGALQMQHLKKLMLSFPYFERVPDQSLLAGKIGEKYNFIIATRGKSYALIYSYSGDKFKVNMREMAGRRIKCSWFDPRTGDISIIGELRNSGIQTFDPPLEPKPGNDWVLVLESLESNKI